MRKNIGVTKILVVEDDQSIAEVIFEALQEMPSCEVMLASTPDEACLLVKDTNPHDCLLDYNLPHMNGIQLYDYICTIQGLENVPTLIMSANLPHSDIKKRKLASIKKPFDLDNLFQMLERLLEVKEKYA